MQVVRPFAAFGIDPTGARAIHCTPAERRTLETAARIVERAHDIYEGAIGDAHLYDSEAPICETADALRRIAAGEIAWEAWQE